jgi:ornithine carbamoyltransferase
MDNLKYNSNLKGGLKHFLDIDHLTKQDLEHLINLSIELKKARKNEQRDYSNALQNKCLAMIFEKNSLRTRVSFDVAIRDLGGYSVVLNKSDIHLGKKETVEDTAKVLCRMCDAIMIRCYDHAETLLKLAETSSVPVINGLTDYSHPCQIVAALSCFKERFGDLSNKSFGWVGAYNNVALSYIQACTILGIKFNISCPDGFGVTKQVIDTYLKNSNGIINIVKDPKDAVKNVNVIITDTWVSMGDSVDIDDVKNTFMPYQVNDQLIKIAAPDVIFSHCLPATRGLEVSASVIDGQHSVVFDEAEYRLHSQKAIMLFCFNKA